MNAVWVTLHNKQKMRLTISFNVASRSTVIEHEAREWAEQTANNDPQHSRYAPWTAMDSGFSC